MHRLHELLLVGLEEACLDHRLYRGEALPHLDAYVAENQDLGETQIAEDVPPDDCDLGLVTSDPRRDGERGVVLMERGFGRRESSFHIHPPTHL